MHEIRMKVSCTCVDEVPETDNNRFKEMFDKNGKKNKEIVLDSNAMHRRTVSARHL